MSDDEFMMVSCRKLDHAWHELADNQDAGDDEVSHPVDGQALTTGLRFRVRRR